MSSRTFLKFAKKGSIFFIILVLLIMIKNISSSILSSFDRTKVVEELQEELQAAKQEQEYLSQKLHIAKTDQFVEEEARTKLGLTKKGEQIVIDDKVKEETKEKVKEEVPNYQKWLKLLNRS